MRSASCVPRRRPVPSGRSRAHAFPTSSRRRPIGRCIPATGAMRRHDPHAAIMRRMPKEETMDQRDNKGPARPSRRSAIARGSALGAAALGAPWVARFAHAQAAELGPYQQGKINWRQAEGEQITVAVIPASYFDNLISLQPQFEALTGIKLRFEKVPPGQIRQKAVLDLSSKTATYATHAADPMYYALYVAKIGRASCRESGQLGDDLRAF